MKHTSKRKMKTREVLLDLALTMTLVIIVFLSILAGLMKAEEAVSGRPATALSAVGLSAPGRPSEEVAQARPSRRENPVKLPRRRHRRTH